MEPAKEKVTHNPLRVVEETHADAERLTNGVMGCCCCWVIWSMILGCLEA